MTATFDQLVVEFIRLVNQLETVLLARLQRQQSDRVSVTLQALPATDSWAHWLNMTSYGQQFMALLKTSNSAVLYVAGCLNAQHLKASAGFTSEEIVFDENCA